MELHFYVSAWHGGVISPHGQTSLALSFGAQPIKRLHFCQFNRRRNVQSYFYVRLFPEMSTTKNSVALDQFEKNSHWKLPYISELVMYYSIIYGI